MEQVRYSLTLRGVVQGVGFRPHVAVCAAQSGVSGHCGNDDESVFIEAQGTPDQVEDFCRRLIDQAPPLATILAFEKSPLKPLPSSQSTDFRIVASQRRPGQRSLLPPDVAICPECLAEMRDSANRRAGYPFITCTNCGPRLSIIRDLPYDRPLTTMDRFPMCPQCENEYQDLDDRRFHAQPISCWSCGPRLWIESASGEQVFGRPDDLGGPGPQRGRLPAGAFRNLVTQANREVTARLEEIEKTQVEPQTKGEFAQARRRLTASLIERLALGLQSGEIWAILGIGGYHLAVDATFEQAVARLRERKSRPHKPLAVMVPDLETARQLAVLSPAAERELTSPARPIVIAPMREGYDLAPSVAPGLGDIGLMLPYTPLHYLIFEASRRLAEEHAAEHAAEHDSPSSHSSPSRQTAACPGCTPLRALVMTSGNVSGEPLVFRPAAARAKLGHVADWFCHHDRPIHQPVEDSVLLETGNLPGGKPGVQPLRRSRGYAPLPVLLSPTPSPHEPAVLASGGEMKNVVALTRAGLCFLSGHVGEMGSLATQAAHQSAIEQLLSLHRQSPALMVTDLHPAYHSRQAAAQWAQENGAGLREIQHHYAHALALLAEAGELTSDRPAAIVTVDGTGYGTDGHIWGGEILTIPAHPHRSDFQRAWHLEEFDLVGGDSAVRYPWKLTLGLAKSWGLDLSHSPLLAGDLLPSGQLKTVTRQVESGSAAVPTSSLGRLFDSVSAGLGICLQATYEGQAAMELEAVARQWIYANPKVWNTWLEGEDIKPDAPLKNVIQQILSPASVTSEIPVMPATPNLDSLPARAAYFHFYLGLYLAERLAEVAASLPEHPQGPLLGISGGVAHNRLFVTTLERKLTLHRHALLTHHKVPAGDGGLALGQAAYGWLEVTSQTKE